MKVLFYIIVFVFPIVLMAQYSSNLNTENLTASHPFLEKEITDLKLYPNPATEDVVYIATQKRSIKNIVVFNVFGKIVLNKKVTSDAFDISELSKGVYILKIIQENKTWNKKLVVK